MKKRGRMGKKAQSKIITVVLLILIVLVAIAIVWTVVANIIEGADLDIEPVILGANIKSFTLDVDQTISLVQVQRSRGKGDVVGLKFIFEDKNGKSYVSEDKNISNKLISLKNEIDSEMKGGFVAKFENEILDGSLDNKIKKIKQALTS